MATSVSRGIWSKFTNRAQSLGVKNAGLKEALLSPNLPKGPVSLKSGASKGRYNSPIGLDAIYPVAYQFLESRSEKIYSQIAEIDVKITEAKDVLEKQNLIAERQQLLVKAEEDNPEVLYNASFALKSVDRTQPVYREYLSREWKKHDRMLTMQRLETLAVIPDTLPTLEPEVHVQLKFPNSSVDTWIEPGKILSSNVTSKPPSFEIIEFEESVKDLYTVLIVNPDTPDVKNNTYSTTLHWGLKDVELSNTDSIIDMKKIDQHPEFNLIDYLPPVPEKNLGMQRFAVWVFRQSAKLNNNENIRRENFNIREFTEQHNLKPIGAHVWRSAWDMNVENVRKMYGLPQGRIFSRDRY